MDQKNWQSVLPELDRYRLRMLQRSVILKMKLLTLLRMALSRDTKLALKILMIYFRLILVNLLLSLASLVPARVTLSIKWLLGITQTMAGKQRLLAQKMRQHIYTLIN